MAYHEAFWIAAAAAAPVIALAAVVAFTDTGNIPGGRLEPDHPDPRLIKTARRTLQTGFAVGFINIVLQAVTLLLALLSLAAGHDQTPLIVAEITAPAGISLLLVSGVIAGVLRVLIGYVDQGLQNSQHSG